MHTIFPQFGVEMQLIRRAIARLFRTAAWVLGLVAGLLAFLVVCDSMEIFAPGSFFFGADLIPAFWLFLLAAVVSLFAFIGGSRRFWIPALLGGILLIYGGDVSLEPAGTLLAQRALASEHSIRVATLNVEYYAEGVDKVMAALDQLQADVVLIGEHALSKNQTAEMERRLAGRTLVAGHPNSTAIISRLPIVWWKEVELPSHEASLSSGNDPDEMVGNRHRSFVHAVARIDSQYVHLLSIRFIAGRPKDHSLWEGIRWGQFMAEEQLRESAFFARYVAALHGPVIFGGDLNACSNSKSVSRIRQVARDAFMQNNFFGTFTFRTEAPILRLDYLFYGNGVRSTSASCPQITVSDHFPVLGSFVIPSDSPRISRLSAVSEVSVSRVVTSVRKASVESTSRPPELSPFQ